MSEASWDELLGGESALLVRLGQLIFIWAKNTSIVKVVKAEDELPEQVEVLLEVEVPPSLLQEADPFMDFCRAFVGSDDTFGLSRSDVKLLTHDLSDYDGSAERAMEGMLALDTRMRKWLDSDPSQGGSS